MPTPFPGMDPYLEREGLWPDLHTALLLEIRRQLEPHWGDVAAILIAVSQPP